MRGAARIEVEIRYDHKRFRLRVRDDGKGIDPGVLEAARTPDISDWRECRNAQTRRRDVAIWSELDSGTEMELTIPASVAYARGP